MPHLYLSGQPVRFETGETAVNLLRKGWKETPIQPTPDATWDADAKRWEVPPPREDQPNYLAFWDAVLVSQTYSVLLGHSMGSLPTNTALTAFIAAFQDAKAGRPNPAAIQACVFLVMGAASDVLTDEHLAELQKLLDVFYLSTIYTLKPPTP
jgi:hypothetical protein